MTFHVFRFNLCPVFVKLISPDISFRDFFKIRKIAAAFRYELNSTELLMLRHATTCV